MMPSSPATSVWLDNANKYQESWRNPNRSSQAATSETESVIESDYSEESVDSHPSVSSATLSFVYSEGGTRQEVGNEVLLSDCRVGYFYYLKHGDSAAILEMAQQCKVDAGQLGHPVLVVGFLSDGRIVCHPVSLIAPLCPCLELTYSDHEPSGKDTTGKISRQIFELVQSLTSCAEASERRQRG